MEWRYLKTSSAEELANVTYFSMKKSQPEGTVRFHITVKEYAVPPEGQRLHFFAQADKQVNQHSAPLLPTGWGDTSSEALEGCLQLIRQFPYQGEDWS